MAGAEAGLQQRERELPRAEDRNFQQVPLQQEDAGDRTLVQVQMREEVGVAHKQERV